MEKNRIKEIIDKKKVVSFDIFDTLLFRNIYRPTDIFRIMEQEAYEQYKIEGFHDLRIQSEAESRNEKNKFESTLDEVYDVIEKKVKKDVSKLKKREIELELAFIDKNPFMKEIFDYALEKKKKVVLISDMYLPEEVVRKLLKKAGYAEVPLYISNKYHASKGSAELYQVACEHEKLDKKSWVHIGDNINSDYNKAKEFGIDAILYDNIRTRDKLGEPKTIVQSILRGVQNNYLYNGNEHSYWERFGALYASPVYYGFTNWLFRLTKEKDNLFFLARDGYVVKKVYDKFKAKEKTKTDTYYLYCSRKTFQLPAFLHKTQDEAIDYLCAFTDCYDYKATVGDILKNIGLDEDNYNDILSIFGFSSKEDVINQNNLSQVRRLLKYLYSDIEIELTKAEKIVLKYLKQENYFKYDRINIMDVGWAGSIQEALKLIAGKKVMGYYFGTIPAPRKIDIISNSLGFAFDEAKPESYYKKIFDVPMMYEFLFSAPHGTTIGFKEKGGKVVPVTDEDDKAFISIVEKMQGAAFEVIDTLLCYSQYLVEMNVEDSISVYDDMIQRRDLEDLKEFRKLTNSVIYTNAKNNYIDEFDKDYIVKNYEEFRDKINKAMWKGSYLIKGIETDEQWNKYRSHVNKVIRRKKVLKAAKNPKRAAKVLAKKILS